MKNQLSLDVVILGLPGSGKGTIGSLFAHEIKRDHLSTGDMLRALDRESELGRKVFALIDKGNFVPDKLIAEMVKEVLKEKESVVLDGFPRTLSQLPIYDELCQKLGRQGLFIKLEVPSDIARTRLLARAVKEGRTDDSAEVIQKRMEVFQELTAPLIARLKKQKRLVLLDNTRPPVEVVSELNLIYKGELERRWEHNLGTGYDGI